MPRLWVVFLGVAMLVMGTRAVAVAEMREIFFAGGCFWGVEEYFSRIPGVMDVVSGYANGKTDNPSYEQVCSGRTGHAETVRVRYDPRRVRLKTLAVQFFKIIDPVSVNRQGNDVGSQYRTGMYYVRAADRAVLAAVLADVQTRCQGKVAVELLPLRKFFPAEEYHQDYLKKHPGGYCHINFDSLRDLPKEVGRIDPAKYSRPDDATLRRNLDAMAYAVTQQAATERPFHNAYWDNKLAGIYVDVTSGEPLFASSDKFDSGTGWPSFTRPIDPSVLRMRQDASHGMVRTEVRSRVGNAHLGHVFDDGPKAAGGLRYCINSAALRFIPLESMSKEGYGDLIPLCQGVDASER
ncbi:MAG: peptide-methionine (R)-S-oxide reductase MsrB [Desulfovibrio sp.]|nr:peptide-methionine (R)-S-oxide reductase MsrB [Desulfovibrio sp.]